MNKIIKNYLALKEESEYKKNLIGTACSRFGDGIDTIAFSLLVYKITGSTLLVATIFAVNCLPNLLFGMISGVVTLHKRENLIMGVCDFGRGICAIITVALYFSGILLPWHLYVLTFANSSFEAFRTPASSSLLPKILRKNYMESGIALQTFCTKVADILGLAIAPLLISAFGLGTAIFLNGVTFFICGICSFLIRLTDIPEDKQHKVSGQELQDLKDGFQYLLKHKSIITIVLFSAICNIAYVPINVFQAPYVEEYLHGGSSMLSLISIGLISGMTITSLFSPTIKYKLGEHITFLCGGLLTGGGHLGLVAITSLGPIWQMTLLLITMFFMGSGIALVNFLIQIQIYEQVEQNYLSRIWAILGAISTCIMPLSSCVIGFISEAISLTCIFICAGILVWICFILYYGMERKQHE